MIWEGKDVPEEWHQARVAPIFKKGDLGDPGNYRPISVTCIAYKILANILLKRIKDAGVLQLQRAIELAEASGRNRVLNVSNLFLKDGRVA